MLEAGFLIKRSNYTLQNDIRDIYLQDGYGRKNITVNIPVLNAYQKGICFYCSEDMKNEGHYFKHFIYSDVKKNGLGAKIIASVFAAKDYIPIINQNLSNLKKTLNGRKFVGTVIS